MSGWTLVLLRHAKAERADGSPDAERPLTPQGNDDAGAAGAWLARRGLRPAVVLCSPAKRTRQTWRAVAVALTERLKPDAQPDVRFEPQLYYGGPEDCLDLIKALPDNAGTALLVGHNPTMSNLSVLLSPDDPVGGIEGLRTCGIAVHRFPTPWATCGPGTGTLVDRHTARATA